MHLLQFFGETSFWTIAFAIAPFQSLPNFHDHIETQLVKRDEDCFENLELCFFLTILISQQLNSAKFSILQLPCQFGYTVFRLAIRHS